MTDVSFIIVNFDSEEFTRRNIESLLQCTRGVSFEILVVDNHSGLDPEKFKFDPRIRVISNEKNLGYGMGCDIGARQAQGKYLYFLNSDILFLNDAATLQCAFLEAHPEVGLLGVRLVDENGHFTPSFDYFPNLSSKIVGVGFLRLLWPARYPRRNAPREAPTEVDLVSGSSLFMPRALYRDIGGFDRAYFLYCEEEDLALRIRQSGRKVFHLPDARLMHAGGGSSRELSALKKEFYISYFKFYGCHYGEAKKKVLIGLTFLQFIIRYLKQPNAVIWRELMGWVLRGHPESESLRFQPGNIDGRP
jgi:GT2 family glycosyltransferase